jgi:hypothetical protein
VRKSLWFKWSTSIADGFWRIGDHKDGRSALKFLQKLGELSSVCLFAKFVLEAKRELRPRESLRRFDPETGFHVLVNNDLHICGSTFGVKFANFLDLLTYAKPEPNGAPSDGTKCTADLMLQNISQNSTKCTFSLLLQTNSYFACATTTQAVLLVSA